MRGQIKGYQYGHTDAFIYLIAGIDSYYVDGVSITYGQPFIHTSGHMLVDLEKILLVPQQGVHVIQVTLVVKV